MLSKIRTIPCPSELKGLYQCSADGSPSVDPARRLHASTQIDPTGAAYLVSLADIRSPHSVFTFHRFLHVGGSHLEGVEQGIVDPRTLRNIIIDEQNNASGILDWEFAGWYPEYWEYVQVMRPVF
ncbi:hypothetical protein N7495_003263 [Penicillium taxi]|uniref:uncharacterized protein n=1 Tax=Penicillium taxi TaxID=168475 RepID=UPI0025452801|nr:uncharacterized protein N7495_003263 [Penicillium taxi]KAJ5902735.1 hypothetical protein N7495_003263 [Penicillium taxi]